MSRLRGIAGEANGAGSAATHVTIKDASQTAEGASNGKLSCTTFIWPLTGRLLMGTKAGRNLDTRKLRKGEKLGKSLIYRQAKLFLSVYVDARRKLCSQEGKAAKET